MGSEYTGVVGTPGQDLDFSGRRSCPGATPIYDRAAGPRGCSLALV